MTQWGGRMVGRLRTRVIERYGQHCWLCGRWIPLDQFSIDHVVPRSKGGSNDLDNLRPAHATCNKRRGTRPPRRMHPPSTPPPLPPPSRSW